jgi:hypothetical protein
MIIIGLLLLWIIGVALWQGTKWLLDATATQRLVALTSIALLVGVGILVGWHGVWDIFALLVLLPLFIGSGIWLTLVIFGVSVNILHNITTCACSDCEWKRQNR